MKKLSITSFSVEEIEALLRSKEDYSIAIRLACMLQIAKGGSSRKAEELLLLSHNQICEWAKRFNASGLEGLKDKIKSGRKPRMTTDQLSWLKKVVLEDSPENYGYNTSTWTAPLLVDLIEKTHSIQYSDDAIYIILKKKLKLSHKKGKGFYAEADKEKRKDFVESLKKTL